MHLRKRVGLGLIGGVVGLAAMELVRRLTAPLVVERARKPTDVFLTARSMSPLGPHHDLDEDATAALGRLGYEKIVGRVPSARTKRALAWLVHLGYGLFVASAYGVLRSNARRPLRDGLLFGAGLWLLGDELAVPLLGLADKPSAYHPTQHLQSLAQHLGFGVATAATTHALEGFR